MSYKRNQVEEAIARTFDPNCQDPPSELRTRIKRLLELDRSLGRKRRSKAAEEANFAFFNEQLPNADIDVVFQDVERTADCVARPKSFITDAVDLRWRVLPLLLFTFTSAAPLGFTFTFFAMKCLRPPFPRPFASGCGGALRHGDNHGVRVGRQGEVTLRRVETLPGRIARLRLLHRFALD